jgi:type II secretory pathway pseudopilin PulG
MNTSRKAGMSGYGLVELLIAVALTSVIVLAAGTMFMRQSVAVQVETQRDLAAQEARLAYDMLSRLMRHATADSLALDYGGGRLNETDELAIENDSLVLDFELPEGLPVWPNDVAPFNNNAVRLVWTSRPGETQHELRYAVADSPGDLDSAATTLLAGGQGPSRPKLVNVDFWPLAQNGQTPRSQATDAAEGGYLLRVTMRTGLPDPGFTNPATTDDSDPLRNFRTYELAGVVSPRN